ncbi:hypothetical protein B4N89_06450 [Embleya scabrispora]|uniref:Uncharacterized protein n=1 Tax=Embleya scabrispora TaxID=159449 RepID=A0A1T3NV51_9ACTN|nr:hypothetical protein B4N89_06450 [Embleya scabrispora]
MGGRASAGGRARRRRPHPRAGRSHHRAASAAGDLDLRRGAGPHGGRPARAARRDNGRTSCRGGPVALMCARPDAHTTWPEPPPRRCPRDSAPRTGVGPPRYGPTPNRLGRR